MALTQEGVAVCLADGSAESLGTTVQRVWAGDCVCRTFGGIRAMLNMGRNRVKPYTGTKMKGYSKLEPGPIGEGRVVSNVTASNKGENPLHIRWRGAKRRSLNAGASGFEDFVSKQYRSLLTFLNHRTATPQDAEDAAQESMARMLRYRESMPASAWQQLLYRIAINVAHDQYRAAASHHSTQHVTLEECELAASGHSPEEQAMYEQQLVHLRKAIANLPPKCQRVYLLVRIHGMSRVQAADHCRVSVKTVEKHLAQALVKLRQQVGDQNSNIF